jgi:hypothetical protein
MPPNLTPSAHVGLEPRLAFGSSRGAAPVGCPTPTFGGARRGGCPPNVSDCGLGTWRENEPLARELPAHEIGHSVESANNGMHGSPAYEIWGEGKLSAPLRANS